MVDDAIEQLNEERVAALHEAHTQLQRATGGAMLLDSAGRPVTMKSPEPQPKANPVRAVESLSAVINHIGTVSVAATMLLELLDVLEDDDGRQIWMIAGEVELEQWLTKVVQARDGLRKQLQ